MAEARSKATWGHTSSVLALIANVNRDPRKGKPFMPDQFNPHAGGGRKRRKGKRVSVAQLTDEIMELAGEKRRKR